MKERATEQIDAALFVIFQSSATHSGERRRGRSSERSASQSSKAALRVFLESLRTDLKDDSIDVTVVSPGHVNASATSKYAQKRPFLVELDDAVERIWEAISARRPSLLFPAPLSFAVWLGQVLPRRLYDRLAGRLRRDRRE